MQQSSCNFPTPAFNKSTSLNGHNNINYKPNFYQNNSCQPVPTNMPLPKHQEIKDFVPSQQPLRQPLPQINVNFIGNNNRRASFMKSKPNMMTQDNYSSGFPSNFSPSKHVYHSMTTMMNDFDMPMDKAQQALDSRSVMTGSTNCSSRGSNYNSEDEDYISEHTSEAHSCCHGHHHDHQHMERAMEGTWKKKVKTELCRFWLMGQECPNSKKEQGCGFAHGQDELQKKKGLSKQYLTSVCKNFLEHPSKCTYGQRCIF